LSGLLIVLPAIASGQDFEQLCERRLPRPTLRIQRVDSGYSIDRQLPYTDLTGIGANARKHGKQNVLGLTRAETAVSIHIRLDRLLDDRSGEECVSPEIDVTIAFAPMTVYIGREFPPNSCSYQEILRHELRHVEAYRDHLPKVEAAVRPLFAQRFNGDILYGSRGILEKDLKKEVSDYWLPLLDSEIRKVELVQAEIDSVEEYERMESVCGGELQKIMNSKR
jgi:hypothetical protein